VELPRDGIHVPRRRRGRAATQQVRDDEHDGEDADRDRDAFHRGLLPYAASGTAVLAARASGPVTEIPTATARSAETTNTWLPPAPMSSMSNTASRPASTARAGALGGPVVSPASDTRSSASATSPPGFITDTVIPPLGTVATTHRRASRVDPIVVETPVAEPPVRHWSNSATTGWPVPSASRAAT